MNDREAAIKRHSPNNGPHIPPRLRHMWRSREGAPDTFDCEQCKCWTANLPLYKLEICPAKDRRKGPRDRRGA